MVWNLRVLGLIALFIVPCITQAAESIYCPQNHGYINVGMTESQVIAACGDPLSKQKSNKPLLKRVPLKQLFYNNQGAPTAFFGVWALPIGNSDPSNPPFGGNAGGVQLKVDILNDKVYSVSLNGTSSNGFSICNGVEIKVGDPGNIVYNACGNPSLINSSYVNEIVPSQQPPEVWIYQPNQYQSPVSLTFLDGKLQSID